MVWKQKNGSEVYLATTPLFAGERSTTYHRQGLEGSRGAMESMTLRW